MSTKQFRILVINPGSTSTKLSLFINDECQFTTDVFHDSTVLQTFPTINDQLNYRMEVVHKFLEDNKIDLTGIDAIVGRGGGCHPVESGVYYIDNRLIEDTKKAKGGLYHSSMLGVQMAAQLQKKYGGLMLMVDPPVVDELSDDARLTGVKGVYRKAVSHALNLKATAKHHAEIIGKPYTELNLIVCHIDGGISITAHKQGRMIDGNNAGGGEGPFTPTRMGSMAITDIINEFSDTPKEQMKELCSVSGGLSSYFHTSNSDTIHKMVEEGDPQATRVWKAMIYQISKYIGAMSTVLQGKVDGIILTGGLLRFNDVINGIKESCSWIAPIYVYPGEFEQTAMAKSALEVLQNQVQPLIYSGTPVWNGFKD